MQTIKTEPKIVKEKVEPDMRLIEPPKETKGVYDFSRDTGKMDITKMTN